MFNESMDRNAQRISAEDEIIGYLKWMTEARDHLLLGDPSNVVIDMVKILNSFDNPVPLIQSAESLGEVFMDFHRLSPCDLVRAVARGRDLQDNFSWFTYDPDENVLETYTEDEIVEMFTALIYDIAETMVKSWGNNHTMFYDFPAIKWILFKFLGDPG